MCVCVCVGGGGGGRGGACSLVPLKTSAFSLVPQNQNTDVLCSLFPEIAFVPVPFSFRLLFFCSPEINGLIPLFPKPLGGPPKVVKE